MHVNMGGVRQKKGLDYWQLCATANYFYSSLKDLIHLRLYSNKQNSNSQNRHVSKEKCCRGNPGPSSKHARGGTLSPCYWRNKLMSKAETPLATCLFQCLQKWLWFIMFPCNTCTLSALLSLPPSVSVPPDQDPRDFWVLSCYFVLGTFI